MNNSKKICNNCKYFFQHYGWISNSFAIINCGHCLKQKYININNCRVPSTKGCAEWEKNENEIGKIKESAKKKLLNMANQIEEIIMLLKLYD